MTSMLADEGWCAREVGWQGDLIAARGAGDSVFEPALLTQPAQEAKVPRIRLVDVLDEHLEGAVVLVDRLHRLGSSLAAGSVARSGIAVRWGAVASARALNYHHERCARAPHRAEDYGEAVLWRHCAGGLPIARRNARLNASSES